MKLSLKVKSALLADYVIICISTDVILLGWSYMFLTLASKTPPPGMPTLATSLAFGAVAAGIKKSMSKQDPSVEGSVVNAFFMALTTTQLALAVHYNLLVWLDKIVPVELSAMIGGLATILLAITNFGNSGYQQSNSSRLKNESIEQETHIDSTRNR
jgi:hypothetical protein